MSRCFPFPPPGYEKKACADDENVLKKEKQKEKKHKKEKDREKREGKEKKDKVRSEEKLREKKERKDKLKDKKDKHKDKERESVLIKKDAARLPEHGSFNQVGPSPVQNYETSDSTFLLEMGKRIGNNADRATEKPFLVQKFTLAGKRNTELPGKDKGGDERKANGQHNRVGWANGFIQKFDGVHQESIGVGGLVENSVEKRTGHGGDDKEKNGEIRRDKHKGRDREKKSEGEGGLAGKSVEKRKEQEQDSKQKNGENRGGKHKEGDREKKSKSKDKKREKEKEKEEKREKKKQKEMKKKQLKQRENSKSGAEGDNVKTALDLLEEKSCSEGSIGKRKEFGTNGYLHDNGSRANKLPKLISSVRQIVENGRKPESCKTAIRFVADVDGNKISPLSVAGNGMITEPCTRPVPSTLQIVENGRRPEPCKPAIHLVTEVGEGNERILTSSSVAENEKILEPYPRPVSSTLQLVENERRAEPCKPAIHFVAEVEGNKRISTSSAVAQNEKILEPFRRPVSSTLQFVKNGRRPEPCKPAIHFVSEVGDEGNKGISTSSAVAENEKISEPFPRPVSSTLQLVKNGRRSELFKPEPAIQFVTEVGEGNKGISTSSAAENEKISESFPRPGVVISASQNEENGRKIEPCKTAVSGIPVGKGNNKVSSSLSAAANGRNPATSSQPDLANGRKIELARTDQSASGKHVVVINHKADNNNNNNNNNEIRVNGKEMAQPSHSLKRPPSSSKPVKEKPPHPDCKYLSSILSVPEVEWDRFDDQEWLFGGRSDLQQAKRSKVDSSLVEGTTKQVWAEALRLESGDVIALPYVVPF